MLKMPKKHQKSGYIHSRKIIKMLCNLIVQSITYYINKRLNALPPLDNIDLYLLYYLGIVYEECEDVSDAQTVILGAQGPGPIIKYTLFIKLPKDKHCVLMEIYSHDDDYYAFLEFLEDANAYSNDDSITKNTGLFFTINMPMNRSIRYNFSQEGVSYKVSKDHT
jgi:hypothetical protein